MATLPFKCGIPVITLAQQAEFRMNKGHTWKPSQSNEKLIDFICRDSPEGATSCCAGRLSVRFCLMNDTSITCFDLIKSSSGRYFQLEKAIQCSSYVKVST
jgi:hypothetical protein